jgi:hypothetical protein
LTLNPIEHERRRIMGVVNASTRLLHVLWGVPAHVSFPIDAYDAYERETLTQEGKGWVHEEDGWITRLFQPIGHVETVAIVDRSLTDAIHRAASHPATTRRVAVWARQAGLSGPTDSDDLAEASRLGIGVIEFVGSGATVLVPPANALTGRPAIYRWWQAEICYRNWLSSTEPIERAANVELPPW